MKLFNPLPTKVLRIRIYQDAKEVKYINVIEAEQDDLLDRFRNLIESQNLSPFQTGRRVSIEVRDCFGRKNGKAKSIAFKGLTVQQTYDLIYNYIVKEGEP